MKNNIISFLGIVRSPQREQTPGRSGNNNRNSISDDIEKVSNDSEDTELRVHLIPSKAIAWGVGIVAIGATTLAGYILRAFNSKPPGLSLSGVEEVNNTVSTDRGNGTFSIDNSYAHSQAYRYSRESGGYNNTEDKNNRVKNATHQTELSSHKKDPENLQDSSASVLVSVDPLHKTFSQLSDDFFSLRKDDKTAIFTKLDGLVNNAKKGEVITQDDIHEVKREIKNLISFEKQARDILFQYRDGVNKSEQTKFKWQGKESDLADTLKRLDGDITTKNVQIEFMTQIPEICDDQKLSMAERVILSRTELRAANAITLTLFSELYDAAKFNIIGLGSILDVKDVVIPSPADGQERDSNFTQKHYYPVIEKIINGSINNGSFSTQFRDRFKADITKIIEVIKTGYSKLYSDECENLDRLLATLNSTQVPGAKANVTSTP